MSEEFRHNPAENRFEAIVDGVVAGSTHYRAADGIAVFDHTEIGEDFGGRGLAGRLVRYAMDEVRDAGQWKVRPVCSFLAGWLDKHPEYSDLRA